MFYEVFIPSNGDEGFDVTITVEADNWMTALKSGLERTGQGADNIRNVMCDIKDDNSIHVTDASTRRVFILKEVEKGANGEASKSQPVKTQPPPAESAETQPVKTEPAQPPADDQVSDTATTQKMRPITPKSGPPSETAPPPNSREMKRVERPTETAPPPESPSPRSTPRGGVSAIPPGTTPPPGAANQQRPPSKGDVAGPDAPTEKFAPINLERSTPEPEPKPRPEPKPSEPQASPSPPPEPEPSPEPEPEAAAPEIPEEEGLGNEESWTSEDGRMRIGSSTFEALQKDEPSPKVVRETRAPSGQRKAVEIGRASEQVSQNVLEEVFLEIQQIHEQGMSMEQVINFVMDLAMSKINAEAGSVMFADVNGRELYFATARGPKAHEVMDFRVPMTKGIVGFCAREGVSLAISDAEKDPRFYKAISDALGYETKNLICAPVQFEGRVYGAIELLNKTSPFSNTEVNVLTYMGRQLAKFVHDLIMSREKLE